MIMATGAKVARLEENGSSYKENGDKIRMSKDEAISLRRKLIGLVKDSLIFRYLLFILNISRG